MTDAVTAKPVKERRISRRVAEAIKLMVAGECKTQKAAAKRAGLHPNYLCEVLRKPEVRVFIDRCARESIAAGTMRASARLMELIDASSEHVAFDATRHMLGIAGIKPATEPQVSVNVDIKAGYVIDISDTAEHPMRIVGPTPSPPAAPKTIEHEHSAIDVTPRRKTDSGVG